MRRLLRAALPLALSAVLCLPACGLLPGDSAPRRDGTIAAPGLEASVTVIRDRFGVPHLYASGDHDLYFAQGYVQAQDRLFQMDLERRMARGELSELFGEATLPADRLFRHLGFANRAPKIAAGWPATTRAIVRAYCDGVNASMRALPAWPVELRLLRMPPRPFDPEDVAAVSLLKSFGLAQWQPEEILHRLSLRLSPERMAEVMPVVDPDSPVVVVPGKGDRRAALEPSLLREGLASLDAASLAPPRSGGSNSWVVSGARSVTGKPLLANDPHLMLLAPSVWYEMHLVAPGVDVYGATFPSAPCVVIGHNPQIAWGFTNLMVDDADFFVERIDGDRVMFRKAWVPMTVRTETIRVKGKESEIVTVRETPHGPILTPVLPGVGSALSFRWAGYDGGDAIGALHALNRAQGREAFVAALSGFPHPCQNAVYADAAGNIGMVMAGRIPIRKGGDRLAPVPGDDGEWEWTGYVPFAEKPQLWNPPGGAIVTANFPVADAARFRRYVSRIYEPPDRGRRIEAMLAARARFTAADFAAMQSDVALAGSDAVLRLAVRVAQRRSGENPAFGEAARTLSSWDRRADEDSRGALVYEVFYLKLADRLFREAMGPALFEAFLGYPRLVWNAVDRIAGRGDSAFLADSADGEGSLDDAAARALLDTMAFLAERLGATSGTWRWGQLHQATFGHPFGKNRFLSRWFDIGPFPVPGDGRTVFKQEFPFGGKEFPVKVGPSLRMIVSPGDRKAATSAITTGQSGHFFEPHYADQAKLWLSGQGHPAWTARSDVDANAESRMTLVPAAR